MSLFGGDDPPASSHSSLSDFSISPIQSPSAEQANAETPFQSAQAQPSDHDLPPDVQLSTEDFNAAEEQDAADLHETDPQTGFPRVRIVSMYA